MQRLTSTILFFFLPPLCRIGHGGGPAQFRAPGTRMPVVDDNAGGWSCRCGNESFRSFFYQWTLLFSAAQVARRPHPVTDLAFGLSSRGATGIIPWRIYFPKVNQNPVDCYNFERMLGNTYWLQLPFVVWGSCHSVDLLRALQSKTTWKS